MQVFVSEYIWFTFKTAPATYSIRTGKLDEIQIDSNRREINSSAAKADSTFLRQSR